MKLIKIGLVAAISMSLLAGCDKPDTTMTEFDISINTIYNNNGEKLKYMWGIYSQCIDGNTYIVGGGKNTNIVQVMDNNNPVTCLPGKENAITRHQNPERGTYKICAGGYSFLGVSESDNIDIIQVMGKNNKATICMPNKDTIHKSIFVHPEIQQKIKDMEAIFSQTENPASDSSTEKANKIH